MDDLPFDTSHPAVRDYLSLIRLQVLTPLSLLINLAAVAVCATVVSPSIGKISKTHPTPISPQPVAIAIYLIAIYAGQLGYCVLLVLARKQETKSTLIKGVGITLVLANWVMAVWAIAWVLEWFIFSTVLQGILLLLLLYSNIALLIYHAPTSKRPFDTMLIHAPMRFFLVLEISLMFPLSLFIALGLTYAPESSGAPVDYSDYQWPGFGVVFGTNILGLLVIIFRRDIVWCISATWICVSIWLLRPKPNPVYATAILFTVLHPIALLGSYIHSRFRRRRGVGLPPDDEHPGLYGNPRNSNPNGHGHGQGGRTDGPREVAEEEVWA